MADGSHIPFVCPGCGKHFRVPASAAGRRGRCPKCREVFEIPKASIGLASKEHAIRFECVRCGRRISVSARDAGRTGKCPACGASLKVPDSRGRAGDASAGDQRDKKSHVSDERALKSARRWIQPDPQEMRRDSAASFCHYAYTRPGPFTISTELLIGGRGGEQHFGIADSTPSSAGAPDGRAADIVRYRLALARSDPKMERVCWCFSSSLDSDKLKGLKRIGYKASKKRIKRVLDRDATVLGEMFWEFEQGPHLILLTPEAVLWNLNAAHHRICYDRIRGVIVQSRPECDVVTLLCSRQDVDRDWKFELTKSFRQEPLGPETFDKVIRIKWRCPKPVTRHLAQLLADLSLIHEPRERTLFASPSRGFRTILKCCVGCLRPDPQQQITFQDIRKPTIKDHARSFTLQSMLSFMLSGGTFATAVPLKKQVVNVFRFPVCDKCLIDGELVRRVIYTDDLFCFSFKNRKYAEKWLGKADQLLPRVLGERSASIEAYLRSQCPTNKAQNWFLGAHIPSKNKDGAIRHYAGIDKDDRVLALKDSTVLGSGKTGFLMSHRGIYYNELRSRGFVAWDDMVRSETPQGVLNTNVKIRTRGGRTVEIPCSGFPGRKRLAKMLNHIIAIYNSTCVNSERQPPIG